MFFVFLPFLLLFPNEGINFFAILSRSSIFLDLRQNDQQFPLENKAQSQQKILLVFLVVLMVIHCDLSARIAQKWILFLVVSVSGFVSEFDSGLDSGFDSEFDFLFDSGFDSELDSGFDSGRFSGIMT